MHCRDFHQKNSLCTCHKSKRRANLGKRTLATNSQSVKPNSSQRKVMGMATKTMAGIWHERGDEKSGNTNTKSTTAETAAATKPASWFQSRASCHLSNLPLSSWRSSVGSLKWQARLSLQTFLAIATVTTTRITTADSEPR